MAIPINWSRSAGQARILVAGMGRTKTLRRLCKTNIFNAIQFGRILEKVVRQPLSFVLLGGRHRLRREGLIRLEIVELAAIVTEFEVPFGQ